MAEVQMASYLNNATNTFFLNDTQVVLNPYSEIVAPAASVVTDGLIIYMDATNTASYPGSGTSIFNLVAGQNYTGSLVNGVTFSGGYLNVAAASTQYIDINAPNYASTNCTVMGATRYTDTSGNGRMISGKTNNWLLGHWSNTVDNYFAEGTVYGIPGSINDTNWRIYTGTNNVSGDVYGFFINGSSIASNGSGAQGPNGIRIGVASNNTEYSDGQFAFILLYNRVLTQSEITQNYDALKSKVGLS